MARNERALTALPDPGVFELGYWLSSEEHTPSALVTHAVAAEDAGFTTAMISDHYAPWVPAQGESPFVWSVLGAIGGATDGLRVGTGVSAALHRMHPVVLAQAAATATALMPGRFFLGLGTGERLNEHMTGQRWPAAKERRQALRDALGVIRDLLDGKTVTRESAHFRVERATIHSRPDTPPPIAVAASGKQTARIAGECADAMIGVTPAADLIGAFEHSGGGGRARLGQVHVCWADTDDAARATAAHWWPHAAVPGRVLSELALPADIAAVAAQSDAAAVAEQVVCGPDPEPIVRAVQRFVAVGYTAVYLHQIGPDQGGFLEFAAKELLPAVRTVVTVTDDVTRLARYRPPPIGEHRLLSDGRSTALLTPLAEIDWWCWPRMHSSPLAWSLLARDGGRAWFIDARLVDTRDEPAGPTARTTLRVDGVTVEVWDGMLACDAGSDLVRLVRAVDAPLRVVHAVRLGGFETPASEWVDGWAAVGADRLTLSGGSTTFGRDGSALTTLRAPRGEWTHLSLQGHAHRHEPEAIVEAFERAENEQRAALARCRLPSTHAERARHALAVVDACTDRITGAVIASPTTSLPEVAGGDRQFDYRFAWLRDGAAAVSVASLVGRLDAMDRSVAFFEALGPDRILAAPVTDVDGAPVPEEREIPCVDGWARSRPVRVGNSAAEQLQYDALGSVLDALLVQVREKRRITRGQWAIVRALADRATEHIGEPSNGIWEVRRPAPFVSADIGRWLALDRAIRIARTTHPWARRRRWRRARADARARVLGAIRPDGTLPHEYGGDGVDSSALLVVVFGLLPASDHRAAHLVDGTVRVLGSGPLLYRYPPDGTDGFSPGESPFVPASWWAVSALARLGRREAQARADALCGMLPALLPEEFDPVRREALGNTPLVWSHAECARALFELDRQRRWRVRAGRRVAALLARTRGRSRFATTREGAPPQPRRDPAPDGAAGGASPMSEVR